MISDYDKFCLVQIKNSNQRFSSLLCKKCKIRTWHLCSWSGGLPMSHPNAKLVHSFKCSLRTVVAINDVYWNVCPFINSRFSNTKIQEFSGDSEILHEIVRETRRICSCFSDFRVVSWTISYSISESPLLFFFLFNSDI